MNDGFGDGQNSSRIRSDVPSRAPDLSPQQREIRRNLEAIGPEIAAYYLDGIKILHSTALETAASLLAHIAREIDGGLRDILSSDEAKKHIQNQLTEAVLVKLGNYSEVIGTHTLKRGACASSRLRLSQRVHRLIVAPQ